MQLYYGSFAVTTSGHLQWNPYQRATGAVVTVRAHALQYVLVFLSSKTILQGPACLFPPNRNNPKVCATHHWPPGNIVLAALHKAQRAVIRECYCLDPHMKCITLFSLEQHQVPSKFSRSPGRQGRPFPNSALSIAGK